MATETEQGVIAEVGSPVLVAPAAIDAVRPWRWTTAAILIAAALLLVFNAHSAREWLDELTPGPINAPLRAPVEGWAGAAERTGLDAPRARLHDLWARARAARFGREEPGERGQGAAD